MCLTEEGATCTMRNVVAALALQPLLTATLAVAAPSPPLEPASPWKLDYQASECSLSRTFGVGKQEVTLRMVRGSGLDTFDMVITVKALPKLKNDAPASLKLLPQGMEQKLNGIAVQLANLPDRFVGRLDADARFLDQMTDAQQVELVVPEKLDVALALRGTRGALKALQTCHDDLLRSWGLDFAALRSAPDRPMAASPREKWITGMDYPSQALREERSGTVIALLTVSDKGSARGCNIIASSKSSVLDTGACMTLLVRARFNPTQNKSAQRQSVERVRYIMPGACEGKGGKGLGSASEAVLVC